MKKKSIILTIMLMISLVIMPNVKAEIASGTSNTCSWSISDAGVLLIKPTSGSECTLTSMIDTSSSPWYSNRDSVKSVKTEGTVYGNTSVYCLFCDMPSVTTIDLSHFDTSKVENMGYMFFHSAVVEIKGLENFDTNKVTNMESMFSENQLKSLDMSSFDMSKVTNMNGMYNNLVATTIKLGNKFDFKIGQNIGSGAFGRGTWLKEEDGKYYNMVDIIKAIKNGNVAGTYKKVSNISNALNIDFPVTYKMESVSKVSNFTTTRSDIYEINGNSIIAKIPLADNSDYVIPGEVSFKLIDGASDENGNKYDVLYTIDNVHLYDLKRIDGQTIGVITIYNDINRLDSLSYNNIEDYRNSIPNASIISDLKQDVTIKILDKSGNPVEGNYIFSAYDIDIASVKDKDSGHSNASGAAGYGTYSEGVNLIDGYDISTLKMSNPTLLMRIGENRITGTVVDDKTELSEFLISVDAKKFKFTWTSPSGAGTEIFNYYQPQLVEIEKQDNNGIILSGAKLGIYKEDKLVKEITTGKTSTKVWLAPGTYVLKEIEAPNNYEKSDDIMFFVDINYKLTMNNNTVDKIVMKDNGAAYKYTINYIDKIMDEVIDTKTTDGEYGNEINAADNVKEIEKYIYDSVDKDSIVIKEGENIINIYYVKKNTVITKYVDKSTDKEIEEKEESTGTVGSEYKTEQKEIDNYVFLEDSGNTTGKYGEGTIVVTYYYEKKNTVIAKYVDKETKEEIFEPEETTGKEGEEYTTEQKKIDGYTFVEVVGEPTGKYKDGIIEVIYYYEKDVEVPNTGIGMTYPMIFGTLLAGISYIGIKRKRK